MAATTRVTVLLVEDDERLRLAVAQALGRAGLVVEAVGEAASALRRLDEGGVDLVVLDIGLPGMDGVTACARIRALDPTLPVLILSAHGDVAARVRGLEAGADDYMVKPFAVRELAARIAALLRRSRPDVTPELVAGPLRVRPAERRAWRGSDELDLSRREFDLLEAFVRSPDVVLSRGTLMDDAWADADEARSNVVDQYVRRLRDKVDRPYGSELLQTVRGVGYRLDPAAAEGER